MPGFEATKIVYTGRGEAFFYHFVLAMVITGDTEVKLICFLLSNASGLSAEQLAFKKLPLFPAKLGKRGFFFGEKPKLASVSAVIGAVTVISLGRQLPSTNGNLLDGSHRVGATHDVLVLRLVHYSYRSSPTFSSRWLSFVAHDHENTTRLSKD